MTNSLLESFFDVDLWLVGIGHFVALWRKLSSAFPAGMERRLGQVAAIQPQASMGPKHVHCAYDYCVRHIHIDASQRIP